MFERRTAIEADTGNTSNGELYNQNISLLSGGIVSRGTNDRTDRAVGKRFGIKSGGSLSVLVVPYADRVLCHCLGLSTVGAAFAP